MVAERHSDPLDEASVLTASIVDGGIAAARRATEPEHHPDFDGESCVSCGDTIPPQRLAMGRVRCVSCQGVIERQGKQFSRPSANASWDAVE